MGSWGGGGGVKNLLKSHQLTPWARPGSLFVPNHSPIKLFSSNAALKRSIMIFCCYENQVMIPICTHLIVCLNSIYTGASITGLRPAGAFCPSAPICVYLMLPPPPPQGQQLPSFFPLLAVTLYTLDKPQVIVLPQYKRFSSQLEVQCYILYLKLMAQI